MMKMNCCNFKKLETAYTQFVEEQKKQACSQQPAAEVEDDQELEL